ncbi:MAG: hypothetical protein IJR60_01750 [Eubacterium sp.]|nr:hypothetical protein [Eubacterium sp.]
MKYFEYSETPKVVIIVLSIAYFYICGLFCALNYVTSDYSIRVLIYSIAFYISVYIIIVLYRRKRLYGVFLYDNYMEISGFKKVKMIKYSDVTDYCYFGDSKREPLLSHNRMHTRGLGGLFIYSIIMFFRSFNKEKGYFTGGNSKDCVRLAVQNGEEQYVVLFSLKDNEGFLEAINEKI